MRAVLVLALALLAAGCIAPAAKVDPASIKKDVSFADLKSTATATVANVDGSLSLTFEGMAPVGVGAPLAGNRQVTNDAIGTFDVDARVGFAELGLVEDGAKAGSLAAVLMDGKGRVECAALGNRTCTVPVVDKDTFSVTAYPTQGVVPPNTPVKLNVTLHPPSHLTWGDAFAGVQRDIKFHVSDTGVPGGEDNIGVLGDGKIFTQKGVHTMMSDDDGATWKEVGPPTTSKETLDPMLFVDATRNIVYVDQLYVGCSILAWSKDEGQTWITNPAACGVPSDDHEKIASGPGGLAGMPMVYYSFKHIGLENVWASRSVDGGVTFQPVPVTMPQQDASDNTGHIFADEKGNVFVPMYWCADGGSMMVGVSHDLGMTYKVVKASDQQGDCTDPDPGLWTDTADNVYLAYHRDDGVYYVYSTDHGDSWSAPVKVSPAGLKSFIHVDAVAGDPGKLAIVYRATPDTAKGPDNADGWAGWHLYTTFVENATSASPTIQTASVLNDSDIVQRGPLCTGGIGCFGGSRNLVDFIDIGVGPDGRVYVTYSDGCKDVCAQPADSRSKLGLVAVETDGPRLFANGAPWAAKK